MALSKIDPAGLDIGQIGGRRNLIINGAMQVAQRGTSSTANGFATVDRFHYAWSGGTTLAATQSQSTDAPDGFATSYKWNTDTADTGMSYVYLGYNIEARDLQHLNYGASSAKTTTLSFWVKSSVIGTYSINFYVQDAVRSINKTYTINSANTWEYKTIVVDGDVTGSGINNDTGLGIALYFILSASSSFTSTDSTNWAGYVSTGFAYGHDVDVAGTLNATFQITGVQLEVGSVATPFEHRSYGEELALCQRYYEKLDGRLMDSQGYEGGAGYTRYVHNVFAVVKRAAPTITEATVDLEGNLGSYSKSSIPEGVRYGANSTAGGNVYRMYTSTSDHIFDAEL